MADIPLGRRFDPSLRAGNEHIFSRSEDVFLPSYPLPIGQVLLLAHRLVGYAICSLCRQPPCLGNNPCA